MSNSSSKNPNGHSWDREFTVVLEDLRSQFRVFGEGLIGLTEKVEKIDERLERVEMILPTLATKAELALLDDKVSHLDDKVSHLDEKVSQLDDKVSLLPTQSSFDRFFNVLSNHETRITV